MCPDDDRPEADDDDAVDDAVDAAGPDESSASDESAEAGESSEPEASEPEASEPEPEAASDAPAQPESAAHTDGADLPDARIHCPENRRRLSRRAWQAIEVAAVTVIALAILVPGIWRYTLVDPWETHYAEVGRRMLDEDDLVHMKWQNEGFRSKPVLTPWLIAAGLRTMGHGEDGGYSGEMVSSPSIMFAVRLPFVLFGVLGLVLMWWMLARLVRRRVAWFAFLIVGTTPFYFFVARQAITDMPMVASLMGALSCFAMAMHSGDAPLQRIWKKVNSHHLLLAALTLFVGWQIIYYASFFYAKPNLAAGVKIPHPHIILPAFMLAGLLLVVFWSSVFRFLCLAALLVFGRPVRNATLLWNVAAPVGGGAFVGLLAWLVWLPGIAAALFGLGAALATGAILMRVFDVHHSFGRWLWLPPVTKRHVYMSWFYFLIGISVLAKGVPGIGMAGVICGVYLLLTNSWREVPKLEIPRGILLCIIVAVPWHVAMWMKDGRPFLRDYLITHNLKRATAGVHGERGTFDFFMSQVGIGMWPWIALLPAAVASAATSILPATREGRVRLLVGIWAVVGISLFSLVQTKFHHYVLPAVPALGILIAFWFDDLIAGRVNRSVLVCVAGAAIVLLVMRDLMGEQKQFIEMFVYRYDRPWPSGEPWNIDLSDTIFVFGALFAFLLLLLPIRTRPVRWTVFCVLGATALAFALWAMNGYMKDAAQHWGQRHAIRTYYEKRHIYGVDIRYFGLRQLADEWGDTDGDFRVDSFIPDEFASGMPMTVSIEIMKNRRDVKERVELHGRVSDFASDHFWIELPDSERAKLAPFIQQGKNRRQPRDKRWMQVNADRLIAWQLYWRGENFWSGDEIWGQSDDTRTAFKQTDNKQFLKYLKDPSRAGRRFFIITEAGRAKGFKNILPTQGAKSTYEILDTSCNKFTLLTFSL